MAVMLLRLVITIHHMILNNTGAKMFWKILLWFNIASMIIVGAISKVTTGQIAPVNAFTVAGACLALYGICRERDAG